MKILRKVNMIAGTKVNMLLAALLQFQMNVWTTKHACNRTERL